MEVRGKVALVTGGNNGLGLGFATGIAQAGGDVVIWGRRADAIEEAAAALRLSTVAAQRARLRALHRLRWALRAYER